MPDTRLLVLLLAIGCNAHQPSRPSLQTAAGSLQGVWVPAQRGASSFAAFLGVPYAAPPLGPLRYKAPQPAKKWTGHLDASKDPPLCAQIPANGDQMAGQEDCLYLNIYVPEAQQLQLQLQEGSQGRLQVQKQLPVVVLIHGSDFQHGSARLDAFGPHFLVMQDLIVVAFQYRLGFFGFASLDTEDIPGNAGLKDMAMVLKWVKQNVEAFGGDPSRVTVLGWSTGGSSAHILSLLPDTRQLFSRAVVLSGHALGPRAFSERHVTRTNTLAWLLGAPNNHTDTVTKVLLDASTADILRATDDARMRVVGLPLPSPERRPSTAAGPAGPAGNPGPGGHGEGHGGTRLLTQDPESLLRQPVASPLPVVLGVSGREGLYPYKAWGLESRSSATLDEMLPRFLPADVLAGRDTSSLLGIPYRGGPGPLPKDAAIRLAKLVRDEYSAGAAIAQDRDTFIQLLSDTFMYESSWRAAGFMANASTEAAPLYLRRFLVDDKYALFKTQNNITLPGVAHTDEIGYLLLIAKPDLHQDLSEPGLAAQVLQRNVEMVARFAKGEQLAGWPPVRPGMLEPSSWPLWEEGPGPHRGAGHAALGPHHAFWTSVYRDLRSSHSSIAGD